MVCPGPPFFGGQTCVCHWINDIDPGLSGAPIQTDLHLTPEGLVSVGGAGGHARWGRGCGAWTVGGVLLVGRIL